MTEIKVQGSSIHPTNEQWDRLVRKPLTARRERLGLNCADLARKGGFSITTASMFTGNTLYDDANGTYISTIVRVMNALDYRVSVENFQTILSIGGSDLPKAISNGVTLMLKKRNEQLAEEAAEAAENARVGQQIVDAAQVEGPRAATTVAFAGTGGGKAPRTLIGTSLTREQADRVFKAILAMKTYDELYELFGERMERFALTYAERNGWVVVR